MSLGQYQPIVKTRTAAAGPAVTIRAIAPTETIPTAPGPAARPSIWDCGPIGTKEPRRGVKGECAYSCVTEDDVEALDPVRRGVFGLLVEEYQLRRNLADTTIDTWIRKAGGIDIELQGGRIASMSSAAACDVGPAPCACPPKGPRWWWLVAIGVAGLWAGTRVKK